MNVCFLQIETLNNKARERGAERPERREGYGFIYCPNHAKHETGIYNPVLWAAEAGGEEEKDWKGQREECERGKEKTSEKSDGNGTAVERILEEQREEERNRLRSWRGCSTMGP